MTVKRDVHPPSNERSKRKTKPARFTRPNCFKVVADLVMGFRSPGLLSFVKKWKEVDQGWTLEFLALDAFYKSSGKVNPEWIEGAYM